MKEGLSIIITFASTLLPLYIRLNISSLSVLFFMVILSPEEIKERKRMAERQVHIRGVSIFLFAHIKSTPISLVKYVLSCRNMSN